MRQHHYLRTWVKAFTNESSQVINLILSVVDTTSNTGDRQRQMVPQISNSVSMHPTTKTAKLPRQTLSIRFRESRPGGIAKTWQNLDGFCEEHSKAYTEPTSSVPQRPKHIKLGIVYLV